MYTDVTLAPDDIEWDNPNNDLKNIIWDNTQFNAYVGEHGLETALERVTAFHRDVANQLIRKAVKDRFSSDWAYRAVNLTRRVKARRQELRRWYMRHHGQRALQREVARLDALYPRAEWGSGL